MARGGQGEVPPGTLAVGLAVASTGDELVNSLVNFVGSAEWCTVVPKRQFMRSRSAG